MRLVAPVHGDTGPTPHGKRLVAPVRGDTGPTPLAKSPMFVRTVWGWSHVQAPANTPHLSGWSHGDTGPTPLMIRQDERLSLKAGYVRFKVYVL